MATLGRRLHQERVRLGLSQQQFAEIGGVKRSSQHLYEHDVRRPDADYLAKIQAAGADVGFLISGRATTLSAGGPVLEVIKAISAFRAVEEFTRKHGGDTVPYLERERLFEFLCTTLAGEPGAVGSNELQAQLAAKWAS